LGLLPLGRLDIQLSHHLVQLFGVLVLRVIREAQALLSSHLEINQQELDSRRGQKKQAPSRKTEKRDGVLTAIAFKNILF
jgi:hypothetical protein